MINLIKNIIDKRYNSRFIEDEIPCLVSFPRTGSHWLRIIIELYSGKSILNRPLLVQSQKSIINHSHDNELTECWNSVIYLYRNPIDTIYSQLQYYSISLENINAITFWSIRYAAHLSHWVFIEDRSEEKIFLTYEKLKNNPQDELKKVFNFLKLDYEYNRVDGIYQKVDKNFTKSVVQHDKKVVSDSEEYLLQKSIFIERYRKYILELFLEYSTKVFADENKLLDLFNIYES